jgi:hypothetical protein
MERARFATGQEEEQFPYGSDFPPGNGCEDFFRDAERPAEAAKREEPIRRRHDSLDEEVEGGKRL